MKYTSLSCFRNLLACVCICVVLVTLLTDFWQDLIFTDQRRVIATNYKGIPTRHSAESGLAPCGDVCSYSGVSVPQTNNTRYTELTKHINCDNIMKRMAYRDHVIAYPPPEAPPDDLEEEFTQFGQCPVRKKWYKIEFGPDRHYMNRTYSRDSIVQLLNRYDLGDNINCYNDSGCMVEMLKKYSSDIKGKAGLVIGTLSPWLEASLLGEGARHITTLEYEDLDLQHPQLEVHKPYDFASRYLDNPPSKFDFAASFSSLEHSGLGRYGDPINPYGDLEAMAQVWCMIKPGGMFLVGVPANLDDSCYIEWNAHRVYGRARLQHLAANWKLVEHQLCKNLHIVLVLTKPAH